MTTTIQPSIMQPLREEHAELLPRIEALREAAAAPGSRSAIEEAYRFLTRELIPHAGAEDAVLYPVVERVMGAPDATATMRHDHEAVGRLTAELGALRTAEPLTAAQTEEARRILYGLYALVHTHFAKEEEIYVPLLEAGLTAAEAAALFAEMEGVAGALKQA